MPEPVPATVPSKPTASSQLKFYGILLALAVTPAVLALLLALGYLDRVLMALPPSLQAEFIGERKLFSAELYVVAGVLTVVIAVGVFLLERTFVAPVRRLLEWLRKARESGFTLREENLVISGDEYGLLGVEIGESVKYFHEAEERQRQIAREKGEFLSVAAHQLRTPLTALRWGVETVASPDTTPEDRKKVAADVSTTILHMIRLVDDFLDVTRIEEGNFGYTFVEGDVVAALGKAAEDAKIVAESRGVTLVFAPEAPMLTAYADYDRIGLAVANLLSNAIQYTEKGGTVTLGAKKESDKIRVSVTDTGMGMTEEERQHLFTKFSRSADAVRMRPDGSGLGLYIVKNIIEKHASAVDVVSAKGKGSTFSFLLPVKKPDELHPDITIEKFFGGV